MTDPCKTDVCQAGSVDGVVCPDDSCDLGNGTRTWEQIARCLKCRVDRKEVELCEQQMQIEKARAFLDHGADDKRWKPGTSAVEALIAECRSYQQGVDAVMKKLKPNLSNDMPWEDEVIICYENLKREAEAHYESGARMGLLLVVCLKYLSPSKGEVSVADFEVVPEKIKELVAKTEKYHQALVQINVIRNSIVAMQGFNFSEHAYPLVRILDDAGIEGQDFDDAHKDFGTLLERTKRAEAERDQLKADMARWKAARAATLDNRSAEDVHHMCVVASLQVERDKLQAFKDFVHRRLDEIGITKEPNGPHSAEGCRVGDRLDEVAYLREAVIEVLPVLNSRCEGRPQPQEAYEAVRMKLKHALKVPLL